MLPLLLDVLCCLLLQCSHPGSFMLRSVRWRLFHSLIRQAMLSPRAALADFCSLYVTVISFFSLPSPSGTSEPLGMTNELVSLPHPPPPHLLRSLHALRIVSDLRESVSVERASPDVIPDVRVPSLAHLPGPLEAESVQVQEDAAEHQVVVRVQNEPRKRIAFSGHLDGLSSLVSRRSTNVVFLFSNCRQSTGRI